MKKTRSLLALLLAVLMLTAAALPISAADAEPLEGKDGSVPSDADELGLIITEYLSNTSSTCVENIWWDETGKQTPNNTSDDTNPATYDAFGFIEFYNAGETAVDMYKYNLASGEIDESTTADNSWRRNQKLSNMVKLQGGSIYDGIKMPGNAKDYATKYPCYNPTQCRVNPGEFVIIWFWTYRTLQVAAQALKEGRAFAGKNDNHKGFRDHYKAVTSQDMPAETKIIAVYAGPVYAGGTDKLKDPAQDPRVTLTTGAGMMYALVDATKTFDVKSTPVYGRTNPEDHPTSPVALNEAIKLLWSWGTALGQGLRADQDYSTIYVPANTTPYVYNRVRSNTWPDDPSVTPASDYMEIGWVDSYYQAAMLASGTTPTPGTMPAYQWALVAPDFVPEALVPTAERTEGWVDALATAFVNEAYPEFLRVEKVEEMREVQLRKEEAGDEEEIEIQLLSREEIEAMMQRNSGLGEADHDTAPTTNVMRTVILIGVSAMLLALAVGMYFVRRARS